MKQLAGLLVEYLVIGAIALMWLIPLLGAFPVFSGLITSKDATGTIIAIALPGIYVVGMVCDFIGYWVTHWKKKKIDEYVWKQQNEKDPGSQLIHVYATCYEPELAEQIEARSSRDRVARGALVAFLPFVFLAPASVPLWLHILVVAVVEVSLVMLWYRFQKLSSKYEAKAWLVIREKHKLNIKSDA